MGGLVDSEMSRDEAAAKASLAALFAKVDTNSNGSLEYKELQCVFGDFADQFLKFCDADDDKAISCDEWLKGILTDTTDLSEEEFQAQWVVRMEGCVAESKKTKWHIPAPGAEDMASTPAERAASQAKADQTAERLDADLAAYLAVTPTSIGGEKEMIVVGAGLVGSLCAVMLAHKGYKVTMFERYGDIRSIPSLGRSINLSVTSRGLRAIRALGGSLYDDVLALTTKVYGRIIHTDGDDADNIIFQRYGKDDSEYNYSISRYQLNVFLIEAADKAGVKIHFDHGLSETSRLSSASEIGADLHFTVGYGTDTLSKVRYECKSPVIACDGGGSRVRYAMRHHGLTSFTEDLLTRGYKEVLFPHPDETLGEGKHFGAGEECHGINGLHIWPRGDHMLMALPNLDGSYTGTIYMESHGEGDTFEALAADRAVCDEFCSRMYKHALPLVGGLASLSDQITNNPNGILGTVHCETWAVGARAVLIGDACHAMVPFFGQGCNCGFEDVSWLSKLLDKHCGGSEDCSASAVAACFKELEEVRKPNADAICTMALENFVEMRDKTADASFLAKKKIESILENNFPLKFRSGYAMVCYGGEGNVTYANAHMLRPIQDTILDRLHAELGDAEPETLDLARAEAVIDEVLGPILAEKEIDLSTVKH